MSSCLLHQSLPLPWDCLGRICTVNWANDNDGLLCRRTLSIVTQAVQSGVLDGGAKDCASNGAREPLTAKWFTACLEEALLMGRNMESADLRRYSKRYSPS
jgi:hypothetical protein